MDKYGIYKIIELCKVKQVVTSSPPPFAERMVQTIKNMIHARLDGLEMNKEKWVELLPSVLKKYNNTKHSTTGMSPHMAKQSSNHVEVWLKIHNKANFNRKYPPLKVGNSVRVYIKPKSFQKDMSQHGQKMYIKSCISAMTKTVLSK